MIISGFHWYSELRSLPFSEHTAFAVLTASRGSTKGSHVNEASISFCGMTVEFSSSLLRNDRWSKVSQWTLRFSSSPHYGSTILQSHPQNPPLLPLHHLLRSRPPTVHPRCSHPPLPRYKIRFHPQSLPTVKTIRLLPSNSRCLIPWVRRIPIFQSKYSFTDQVSGRSAPSRSSQNHSRKLSSPSQKRTLPSRSSSMTSSSA